MKKTVSLKDIATQLGVSVSLVSYVLNGHAKKMRVRDEVAEEIITTAKKLNYQPNQIAKSLKTKKSQTIGLIVGEIHYRYTTGIARAVEAEAKRNKYTVIIGNSHEELSKLSELMHVLINRQVDGLIIVAAENAEKEVEFLKKREIPFVLIDRNFPSVEANFIGIDNYQVAYDATTYLIRRGYSHIAFVTYATTFFHLKERTRGYMKALKDNGLKGSLCREIRKSHYEADVTKTIKELTGKASACDAIFFATDTLANTGLKNLIEMKVSVPEDLGVISFDESEAFNLFQVPVTHYRQPLEEIGVSAVKALMEGMKDHKKMKQVYLQSTLVVGKSCGE
jgi:LacI family transcriptional regulator